MNSDLFQITFPALTPKETATEWINTSDIVARPVPGVNKKIVRETGT